MFSPPRYIMKLKLLKVAYSFSRSFQQDFNALLAAIFNFCTTKSLFIIKLMICFILLFTSISPKHHPELLLTLSRGDQQPEQEWSQIWCLTFFIGARVVIFFQSLILEKTEQEPEFKFMNKSMLL